MVGSGMGAKRGILIRKGEAIQTIKEVTTIGFDKTGTITKGKPEVTDIYTKISKEKLLIRCELIGNRLLHLSLHLVGGTRIITNRIQPPLFFLFKMRDYFCICAR